MNEQLKQLKEDFKTNQNLLWAVGDSTRQSIILALFETTCTTGMRVGEITKRTHLSRPAVSHHLKILKDAGVVTLRKEGTMNFYTMNLDGKIDELYTLVAHLKALIKHEKGNRND